MRRAQRAVSSSHGGRPAVRGDSSQLTMPSCFMQPSLPALAEHVPAVREAAAIAGDVLRQCVQRKVRRGEADVTEERLVGVLGRVLLQALDRVVGDRRVA